ncbi:MAG: AAA family ATPase [Alphaproteobacteria bacterium]|nr:AAA family ATPase [Alphaproteobacteria bacterium]
MINQITLTNFRNHKCSRIKIGNIKNIIITGLNGAGKTAVLEALSLLSGEKGLRGADMQMLSRFDGDGGFSVFANTEDESDVCVFLNSGDSNRRAKIDNENVALAELAKKLRIVWLTPREDRIFLESAGDRRAFFDRLCANFEPAHVGRISRLNKLLTERAGVLKNGANKNWLDALDSQIAATAVAIAASRIRYAGEINYFFETGAVSVNGVVEKLLLENTATIAEQKYLEYLQNNRDLIGDKMVIDGAHKSDFGVFNKKLNLPAYITSTGQQKSILIDLILAHAKLIHIKTGQKPLILLDEAAAHLDENARIKLFADLNECDAQVWATGLDINIFKNIPNALFVTCKDGEISNIVISKTAENENVED